MTNYWIGVASLAHVKAGIDGGYAQLGFGKRSTIAPLKSGDWIAFYSPRTEIEDGNRVQAFTAIGRISSGDIYQVDLGAGFKPFRLPCKYRKSARDAKVHPLLARLSVTRDDGDHWGVRFRQSRISITRTDMVRIASAMNFALPKTRP